MCTGGMKAFGMRMTRVVAGADPTAQQSLGAQWVGIQVQVIAG